MLIDYVNIRQGTDSDKRFSRGNTLPLIQRPFGMAAFTLQTNGMRGNWFYHPGDCSVEGLRLTHQPSPWMGDYGQVLFMPQQGRVSADRAARYSSYQPKEAVMTPSYLELFLLRDRLRLSFTPTERCAVMRLEFTRGEKKRLSIWSEEWAAVWEINKEKREICGTLHIRKDGCPQNFKEYINITFDCPLETDEDTYRDKQGISPVLLSDSPEVRIGISFISQDQARQNMKNELAGKSFEQVQKEGSEIWEKYLGKIMVEGPEKKKRTFYSCMYRCFLFPRRMFEIKKNGKPVHISMQTGQEKDGVFYTNNGFWDTYRTLYPLYSIIIPDILHEILQGYINFYHDTGWFPRWLSPGERGTMPGTLIDAVMADAAVKDILSGEELQTVYEGLKKHALQASEDSPAGRTGLEDYIKYGYLPYTKFHESVSNTLDYLYGDFCISRIGEKLQAKDRGIFLERAMNYRRLFHPENFFFVGKDEEGSWRKDFDPFTWGGGYCEGGPWQSGFGVCFDFDGWLLLFPSKKAALRKIRDIFSTAPEFRVGSYGSEIHEMTEMAFAGFGQCAISNQPSFLLPYYPVLAGDAKKSARVVNRILDEAFDEEVFPGDEDNGSMAAWYVLSSLGIYPYCPGIPEYLRLPLYWDRATVFNSLGKLELTKENTKAFGEKKTIISHKGLLEESNV